MARICLICTLMASIPSLIILIWKSTKTGFLYSLFNVSLAFFLFSFQVHEKTILIPALSAILLFPFDPFMVFWFLQVSTFSMLPLLVKDQLLLPYIGLSVAYILLGKIFVDQEVGWENLYEKLLIPAFGKFLKFLFILSTLGHVVLIFLFLFVDPPKQLPFLFPLLISAYSCCHFCIFFVYFNLKQFFCNEKKFKTN